MSVGERHQHAIALLPAYAHQRLVDNDPREPGTELRAAAKLADVAIGIQVCVLKRVLGLGIVPENGPRHPEESAVVAAHQRLERGRILLRDATRQLEIVYSRS